MMFKKKSVPLQDAKTEARYLKEQYLASQAFSGVERDMIAVILEDGRRYTKSEVQEEINQFTNRGVK
ncbi:hypothetical protein D3C76_1438550 [compost metagenome]